MFFSAWRINIQAQSHKPARTGKHRACLTWELALLSWVAGREGDVLIAKWANKASAFMAGALCLAITAPLAADQGWPSFGNDVGGTQYSSLDQINRENVKRLKRVWAHRSGDFKKNPRGMGLQSVPVMANDTLYYCTPFNRVFALDPATGAEKWVFDPHVPDPETGKPLIEGDRLMTPCRGVAYWESDEGDGGFCSRRVFRGDRGGNLWAIDADTGRACADFGADRGYVGRVNNRDYEFYGEGGGTAVSPPLVIGDLVVVAQSSNDGVQNAADGQVRGFDVRSGALRWTFNPIPEERRLQTGAANVWSTMSGDAERNLVFLPTTSPSTDYYGGNRKFDMPNVNAIVALDGASGDVAWSFQTVRHDLWDYDLVGHPLLSTIRHKGEEREVAILQTKMGWVFVFDRETGEPLWDIEEVRAPASDVPGEEASRTQPRPVGIAPFAGQEIRREKLFGLTPFDRGWCRAEFDKMRYEGMYTPPSLGDGSLMFPSALGGGNWGGAAYDPQSNLLIVKSENLATRIRFVKSDDEEGRAFSHFDYLNRPLKGTPYGVKGEIFMSPLGIPCTPAPWGTLTAINLDTGEEAWQVPLGQVKRFGVSVPEFMKWGSPTIGGPIVTGGGLIFIASTMDSKIRALEVATGKTVWRKNLPHDGASVPITYMYQGRQYVVISAGGSSMTTDNLGDALVAFALPKKLLRNNKQAD